MRLCLGEPAIDTEAALIESCDCVKTFAAPTHESGFLILKADRREPQVQDLSHGELVLPPGKLAKQSRSIVQVRSSRRTRRPHRAPLPFNSPTAMLHSFIRPRTWAFQSKYPLKATLFPTSSRLVPDQGCKKQTLPLKAAGLIRFQDLHCKFHTLIPQSFYLVVLFCSFL